MKTKVNRVASLLVAALVVYRRATDGSHSNPLESVVWTSFGCLFALSLIWFGRLWNEVSMRTYRSGKRFSVYTPSWIIAGAGWAFWLSCFGCPRSYVHNEPARKAGHGVGIGESLNR